ncbi:MAG: FG-GAP-like repeat-containing protein [Actinomycetales bacterium]
MTPFSLHRFVSATAACAMAAAGMVAVAGPATAATAAYYSTELAPLTRLTPDGGVSAPLDGGDYRSVSGERYSGTAVVDLDGNGSREVLGGFGDGTVKIWSLPTSPGSGSQLIRSIKVSNAELVGTPAVGDVNNDGHLDVAATSYDGWLKAYDGRTGNQIFAAQAVVNPRAYFSSPVIKDIDKDGVSEIIVTGIDHHLHVYNVIGGRLSEKFTMFLHDTSYSTPALGDLDGDGKDEIVFGYDCDGVGGQPCAEFDKSMGGYVTAVNSAGQVLPGFPKLVPHQVVWSSPALDDLNGDGRLDIVVGTGDMPDSYCPPQGCMNGGREVYAFDGFGQTLPGWPVNIGAKSFSSPAVGDLNLDGSPEVAIVGLDGRLNVISADGSMRFVTQSVGNTSTATGIKPSASIADVTGDGRQEVIVAGQNFVNIYNAWGTLMSRTKATNGDPIYNAPTIVPGENGGNAIITVSSTNASGAKFYAYQATKPLGRADWPTFHQNAARTGLAARDLPARQNKAINVMRPGEVKIEGQGLTSLNGQHRLEIGSISGTDKEGLAIMRNSCVNKLFATSAPGKSFLVMQETDGNLVMYTDGKPTWASYTTNNAGGFAIMQNDGNLVVYRADGTPIWASWSLCNVQDTNDPVRGGLTSKHLQAGQYLTSPNGKVRLVMQNDGNLVLYTPRGAVWNSGTSGGIQSYLKQQTDGKLIVYNQFRDVQWGGVWIGANTNSAMYVQDDGNLVQYKPNGQVIWSSNTWGTA